MSPLRGSPCIAGGSPVLHGEEEARPACLSQHFAIAWYGQSVLVTEMLKLAPSAEEGKALLATVRACNAAATRAAEVAFQHQTASKIRLQALCYASLREEFGLSAQMAIRAIAKACGACKRDKNIQPKFRLLGAVA